MPEQRLTAGESDVGKRLDRFLAEKLPERSRSVIQRWIGQGLVTVDGSPVPPRHRIKTGQEVVVQPPPEPEQKLVPEPIPLQVIFEDDCLIVVDKPSGLVVHPGAGNTAGTLANALAYHFSKISKPTSLRPGIVHRLDKETSGLLVVAKSEGIHEALARQFKERTVVKRYLALVYGCPRPDSGVIDVPIGRHPRARIKYSTRTRKPRSAKTEYTVRERIGQFTLLEVKLHTGRTHQIRVHLHHIGHPVVGDALYGKRRKASVSNPNIRREIGRLGRHFLHAAHLGFLHPVTGKKMAFDSPLPAELARFMKALE